LRPVATLYGDAPAHIVLSTRLQATKAPDPYTRGPRVRNRSERIEMDGHKRPFTTADRRISPEKYIEIKRCYKRLGSYAKVSQQMGVSKQFVRDLILYGLRPVDTIGYEDKEQE